MVFFGVVEVVAALDGFLPFFSFLTGGGSRDGGGGFFNLNRPTVFSFDVIVRGGGRLPAGGLGCGQPRS